jgi:predicted nucleotidyltransferase
MVLSIGEITQKLTPVFEQNGVTKAILFGSYAKGTATERSDVDLVVATDPGESALKIYTVLAESLDALEKKIDLVPHEDIIPDGPIDVEVSQTGVVIYERQ